MNCCACPNPAFDNHPKAPLCAPCLDAWRDIENSPRITQPLEDPPFSDLDRELKIDVIFAELDRELTRQRPALAERIRRTLAGGDAGLVLLVALAGTTGLPGVSA